MENPGFGDKYTYTETANSILSRAIGSDSTAVDATNAETTAATVLEKKGKKKVKEKNSFFKRFYGTSFHLNYSYKRLSTYSVSKKKLVKINILNLCF